ncbi:peptidylprolyl isomerase [Marinilabiliaceae bacterium JC017]|nr:peptidylprolyl isomerase [Marinilabiliaceae bacterium JC017]
MKFPKTFHYLSLLLLLTISPVIAQENNQPLLTIGDQQYTTDEFEYIYNKNNRQTDKALSKEEYLDLFVKYKLKVTAAISEGYDTLPSFINEFNHYRDELAKPYLTDKKTTDKLVQEAYSRLNQEVDASHILIRVSPNATPADTLTAYNKIRDLRQKIQQGADFAQIAQTYSEDPSARSNKGRLGFFTGFQMVYSFESAAFNTPAGKVSPIIRTRFGYHLVKVHNKRPARGEVKVAHIMKAFPQNASQEIKDKAKNEINSLYQRLQDGENFKTLAQQYSDDKNSAVKGGELPWFGLGRMVPAFSDAAFSLTTNDSFGSPIQTPFGWHIIYRINHRGIKPLEEIKDEILQKIQNDERALSGTTVTVKRLKDEYHFTESTANANTIKDHLAKSSELNREVLDDLEQQNLPLMEFAHNQYTTADFSRFLSKRNYTNQTNPVQIEKIYQHFIETTVLDYEKQHLEEKYPEFRFLMNEYHDGLLIFEISQKEIWTKATSDSLGLTAYYEANKNKYLSTESFEGTIYYCGDKKTLKKVKKLVKKSPELTCDSLQHMNNNLFCEKNTFKKGTTALHDKILWKIKTNETLTYPHDFSNVFYTGKFVKPFIIPLNNTKGQVISDYQQHLEEKWIEMLKDKFHPVVKDFAIETTNL